MMDNAERIKTAWVVLRGMFKLQYSEFMSELDVSIIPEFLSSHSKTFNLTEEDISLLLGYFEQEFTTQHKIGQFIAEESNDHEKWWRGKLQRTSDNFYWDRLEKHLKSEGSLPEESIDSTAKDTDALMDLIANPNKEFQKRRGMVIGQVQAGKTLNYSSLISKAADAGYKYIILLAGLTNSLRTQTQERIDEAFVGRISSNNTSVRKRVGVGLINASRTPLSLTFFKQDFLLSNLQSVKGLDKTHIRDISEPIIFVCKKNVNTLKNLNQFLSSNSIEGVVEGSLLLIDDEADNASVNTKAKKREITAINSSIRDVIKKFKNSSYVGYTATPFANIFIDNDVDDELAKDDLFPRDFIYSLDASNKYVSSKRVFGPEGDLGEIMLRTITDNDDYIKIVHKKDANPIDLPPSLKTAIRLFFLAKVVRNHRRKNNSHCSMMVNVSRFNDVQGRVKSLIKEYVQTIKEDLRLNSKAKKPSSSSVIHEFLSDYKEEFLSLSDRFDYPDWQNVSNELSEVVNEAEILTVNMKSGELDYRSYPNGRTVIAIGGLALSRGLTLEGLVTTYILRNAAAYDTLLQLGRWFGYRPNYEDLCRLFIDADSQRYYADVTEAIDELVEEITEMKQLGLTPFQFGLKVKQNPDAIRITAANKMDSAELVTIELGYAGKLREGHTLYNDDAVNKHNRSEIFKFLQKIGPEKASLEYPNSRGKPTWTKVSAEQILSLLDNFKLPAQYCTDLHVKDDGSSFISDFIRDKKEWLNEWIVCLNNTVISDPNEAEINLFPGMPLRVRKNESGVFLDNGKVFGITARRRVGSGGEWKVGLMNKADSDHQLKKTDIEKPILNIYVNKVTVPNNKSNSQITNLTENSVTYSVYFPTNRNLDKTEVKYQVNKIFQQARLVVQDDYDEDEYELS